ncbi:MAG: glycosyltransferase [Saprospiraceae bacterium]|nr:glycosyltransferase [Saprospiraceae bacterium]
MGAPGAINLAWAKACGEYMCRFDGDDKWYREYLQEAADALDKYTEAVLVHTDVSFIDEAGNITKEKNNIQRPSLLKFIDNEFAGILENIISTRLLLWPEKAPGIKYCPGRKGSGQASGTGFVRLMLENHVSCFIDKPLAYYRIHTSNMHRAMIKDKSAEINTLWILDFFKNHNNSIVKMDWNKIYFEQNKHLGFAYYFHGMDKDARRNLNRAMRYRPMAFFNLSFTRIWLASIVGKKRYDSAKSVFFSFKK